MSKVCEDCGKIHFKCGLCGGEFASPRSEADTMAEAEANFGHIPEEDRVSVCSDCYHKSMTAYFGNNYAGAKEKN